jgi:Hint domain
MANESILSGGTYTLSQALTNGTNIEFLNEDGDNGVLIVQNGALDVPAVTVGGTLSASAYFGGTVTNFQPGAYGIPGDQVILQQIETLFAALDVSATASADNAAFDGDITLAAQSGVQLLLLPDGEVEPTTSAPFTLDANTQLVIDEMAQALFGTAAAADGATLDLSFSDSREDPNSNHPFIDGVITTDVAVNPCFAAGTRILTARGEVAVEDLAQGDEVITHEGEEQPIIWIGKREVDITAHCRPETVRPIIIEPDALGDGMPARRLMVSPDHALFLDGVLVPAKELMNWTNIRQDNAASRVTYYHLELSRHDVIFAEGVPAESYLDTGHRGIFDNAEASIIAHPALMQERREREGCAPLCLGGPVLDAIRQRLASRQAGIRLRG